MKDQNTPAPKSPFGLFLGGGGAGDSFTVSVLGMGLVKFSMMNFQTFSEIVFEFRATPQILMTALIFGGFMGVLGGFLPAVQAARTKAIEAMRG